MIRSLFKPFTPPKEAGAGATHEQALLARLWLAVLLSAAFAHFWAIQPYGLGVNKTPSLPEGVYLTKRLSAAEVVAPGDWVCLAYQPPQWAQARQYLPPGANICKPVAAIAGQSFKVTDTSISVLGGSKSYPLTTTDSAGRPVPKLNPGVYTLQPAEMLLLSPYHPLSLDARILGTVSRGQLTHRIWPVFTKSRAPL